MLGSDKSLAWHLDDADEDDRGTLVIEEVPNPLPCDYAWSFRIQVLDRSW